MGWGTTASVRSLWNGPRRLPSTSRRFAAPLRGSQQRTQQCADWSGDPLNRWHWWKHMKHKESIQSMNLQCWSCICNWLFLKHSMFNTVVKDPIQRTWHGPQAHSRSLVTVPAVVSRFHTALLHYLWAICFSVLTERFRKRGAVDGSSSSIQLPGRTRFRVVVGDVENNCNL